jgi:nucleoside phosphorylase/CheY-like chemotaxis protein
MLILLVDDNREKLRTVLDFLVKNCGVSREYIKTAQNGMAAREALDRFKFDLLILDILLPLRDEDTDALAKTSLDLLTDIHNKKFENVPDCILGLTGYDELPPEVNDNFAVNAWTVIKYDSANTSWQAPLKNTISYMVERRAAPQRIAYQTDLCVVTALRFPEFEQMLKLNWSWGDETPLDDHVFVTQGNFTSGGRSFSVSMCCAPRMGMIASALVASRMIERLRPRFLAMTGICAGVEDKAQLGDVLLADPGWNWQSGKLAIDTLGPYFAAAPHPLDIPEFIRSRAKALSNDPHALLEIKRAFMGQVPDTELKLRTGAVASGSAVLADSDIVKEIQRKDRSLIGIEMEVYGIYAAANYASVPRPTAFAMKSVCDFGTKIKNDEFQAYAAYTSAQTFALFCERYFHEIYDLAGT